MYTKRVLQPSHRKLTVVEVGPRDGLQNEREVVPTADKVELIRRMIDSGVRRIEVASFVNPARVPQMADAEGVVGALPDRPDVSYIGLCLNKRGVFRALATRDGNGRGIDEIGCVIVATDEFGRRNQGQSVAEGLAEMGDMLRLARDNGLKAQATIGASFGCPFEGEVPQERVVGIAAALAEAGAEEIALADTIGVAVPSQVRDLVGAIRQALPQEIGLRGHFHDTRGTGIANAWAAYEAGVDVLDSSLGGLGGCPFAPQATGNIATEDLIYLLSRSGVETGVDLAAVIDANRWFEGVMGKPLPGRVSKAGSFGSQTICR